MEGCCGLKGELFAQITPKIFDHKRQSPRKLNVFGGFDYFAYGGEIGI